MKKILSILLFSTFSFLAHAQIQKVTIQASGLTCSMCNKSINASLKNVIFIQSVESDINNNSFTITFKPGIKPDFDLLKKKVQDAGFSIANLWVYASFNNQKIANDAHVTVEGLNIHFVAVDNQVLNGEKKLQLIDKDFTNSKNYKKFSSLTSMECFKTGLMAGCCKEKMQQTAAQQRVYHVTI